jgi:hypothetical protein
MVEQQRRGQAQPGSVGHPVAQLDCHSESGPRSQERGERGVIGGVLARERHVRAGGLKLAAQRRRPGREAAA